LRPSRQPPAHTRQELFGRIGPVRTVNLIYDRQDRSTGVAYVVYPDARDARAAIEQFDGANANGQPITLALVPPPRSARSLFERVDGAERRRRAAAATTDDDEDEYEDEYSGVPRRSNVRGPPPENIDRYVPGMDDTDGDGPPARGGRGRRGTAGGGGGRASGGGGRRGSPRRENSGGARRPGQRHGGGGGRREERDADGHPIVHGRPRKTAEELDAEMADYWGGAAPAEQNGAAGAAVTDDVDMDII
jgi:THO complex subunit 4